MHWHSGCRSNTCHAHGEAYAVDINTAFSYTGNMELAPNSEYQKGRHGSSGRLGLAELQACVYRLCIHPLDRIQGGRVQDYGTVGTAVH